MLSDHISYQALRQPHAIAVVTGEHEITYRRFEHDINCVARRIAPVLPSRCLAEIRVLDIYHHWLLILALARLGHVSMSGREVEDHSPVPDRPKVTIFDRSPNPGAEAGIEVSPDWFKEALAGSDPGRPRTQILGSDPARIFKSSGTTGKPKSVLLNHALVVDRVRIGVFGQQMRVDPRILVFLGIETDGGFCVPLRTWYFGNTVYFVHSAIKLVSRQINAIILSTTQLKQLIDLLPHDFQPLPNLTVTVGGSFVSNQLIERTHKSLTPNLFLTYGSTETGTVANCPASMRQLQADVTGAILPWVHVQIVDADDQPLPLGSVGNVRIKSSTMVHAYAENPELTARVFRDGWFYPGDLGTMSENGLLRIVGRADDMMNIGGHKMAPQPIEEFLLTCPQIKDAAVFSVPNEQGLEQLHVAVVKGVGFEKELVQSYFQKIAGNRLPFKVMMLTKIPRNEMGKIERFKLKETVRSQKLQVQNDGTHSMLDELWPTFSMSNQPE